LFNLNALRSKNRLVYPNLWKGCICALCPSQTGPSGATVYDFTGNGFHGAIRTAATPVALAWPLDNGYANQFMPTGGTKPYIDVTIANQQNTATFSFTCWFNITAWGTDTALVYSQFASKGLYFTIDADLAPAADWNTPGSYFDMSNTQTLLNRWNFAAMVVDGTSNIKCYLNKSTRNASTTVSSDSINGVWRIGAGKSTTSVNGMMDDCRFYNRALTPGEIAILARSRGESYKTKQSFGAGTVAVTNNRNKSTRYLCYPV